MLYESLLSPPQKQPYMLTWERDLDCAEDLESWCPRLQVSYKGILNISLIEASLKVLTRWYIVPTRLTRMYNTDTTECFRGCNLRGSMLHIWWECPKIRTLWNRVFSMIFILLPSVSDWNIKSYRLWFMKRLQGSLTIIVSCLTRIGSLGRLIYLFPYPWHPVQYKYGTHHLLHQLSLSNLGLLNSNFFQILLFFLSSHFGPLVVPL